MRGNGHTFVFADPGPALIVLPPGEAAVFYVGWFGNGSPEQCPPAIRLEVTPPDEYAPVIIPMRMAPCLGGMLDVSTVEAPT